MFRQGMWLVRLIHNATSINTIITDLIINTIAIISIIMVWDNWVTVTIATGGIIIAISRTLTTVTTVLSWVDVSRFEWAERGIVQSVHWNFVFIWGLWIQLHVIFNCTFAGWASGWYHWDNSEWLNLYVRVGIGKPSETLLFIEPTIQFTSVRFFSKN